MDERELAALGRAIAERLAGVKLTAPETTEADYASAVERVVRQVPAMRATVKRNKARVEDRYGDLVDQPEGRQATVIANSSPPMLLALTHSLMRTSFANRFDDVQRSLALAKLARLTAQAVARTPYLSAASASDLIGESLCHLGNALRLNSDLAGAEGAFKEAETHLDEGTRDRDLRADHLSFVASLRLAQGRADEALRLWERETAIRRLLRDPEKLGTGLIAAGLAACWTEDLLKAAKLIREGGDLVQDGRMLFLGLLHLAEAFARSGNGLKSWKLLCAGDLMGFVTELGDGLNRRQRWVKALVHRSLGEAPEAERMLTAVRDEFIENKETLRAGLVALDLLAALAAQGKHSEVIPLAEATYRIFVAERLEKKALAAYMILHRAALAETLTEELAVKVANFIMLRQHNKKARFE